MRYLDVCAGISASSVAWKPLGWEAAAYSEIEAAPRAVLEHRQGALPVGWDHRHVAGSNTTPLFGDFTQIEAHHVGPIDLLVGGTPCQDFSVAGLRAGLDGDRGNLSLEFLRLADRTRPRWVVWENVPGVLSINGGRAFGAILGGLGELGYGFAYRVLDAQHFGVPQRRRRVFVVGYLGDHRRAGAVLFERQSMSGHPAPRRETREGHSSAELGDELANAILTPSGGRAGIGVGAALIEAYGGNNTAGSIDVATALTSHGGPCGRLDFESETFITHALRGEGFDASEDGTGRGTPIVPVLYAPDVVDTLVGRSSRGGGQINSPGHNADQQLVAFTSKDHGQDAGDLAPTLRSMSGKHANAGGQVAVAYGISPDCFDRDGEGANGTAGERSGLGVDTELAYSLRAKRAGGVATASAVRRLTPRECERLQGFPDDYTLVPNRGKPMADGPRYKCLGNSMAVPVMAWIGQRIAAVDALADDLRAA